MPKHPPHRFPKAYDDTVLTQSTLNAVAVQHRSLSLFAGLLFKPGAPTKQEKHSNPSSQQTSQRSSRLSDDHSGKSSKLTRQNVRNIPRDPNETVYRFQIH